jgi:hypothetical protein
MATPVPDPDIDNWFPVAASVGYHLTSDETDDYNCIAWAAGLTDINWWPYDYDEAGWGWAPGARRIHTLDAFVEAYQTLGYKPCGRNGRLQRRYEKIAIYVDLQGKPTHAARQLRNGLWTSKLGRYRDIQHHSLNALEFVATQPWRDGIDYGKVAICMRRKRKPGDVCLVCPGVPDVSQPPPRFSAISLIRRLFRRG